MKKLRPKTNKEIEKIVNDLMPVQVQILGLVVAMVLLRFSYNSTKKHKCYK
jgi:hypothetical protein